jgi:hypothetical protein
MDIIEDIINERLKLLEKSIDDYITVELRRIDKKND